MDTCHMLLNKNNLIYFFFLLAVVAGCDRNTISGDPQPEVIEDMPINLGVSSSISFATKATVNSWNDDVVYIFGMKRGQGGAYDFDDPSNIVNWPGVVASDNSVGLYASEYVDEEGNDVKVPFYYEERCVYDFFGYHLGGAEVLSSEKGGRQYKMDVRFFGNNDIMYAYTNRENDLFHGTAPLSTSMLYSATAARGGVQPTLKFYHVLTRFIFVPVGSGDCQDDVVLEGLSMKSVDSGTLTLMDGEASFVPTAGAEQVDMALKNADDTEYTPEVLALIPDKTPMGGNGASLMLAPGMDAVDVTLYLKRESTNEVIKHSFIVNASEFSSGHSNFKAGYSYTIRMIVYGLQKIEIEAGLEDWIEDDYIYDPDDPTASKPVTGEHPMGDKYVSVGDYTDGGNLGEFVD